MSSTRKSLEDGQVLKMGEAELVVGETMQELRDCNDLLEDNEALKARMAKDGYLLIRDFYSEEEVLSARREILECLEKKGKLEKDAPLMSAKRAKDAGGCLFSHDEIAGFTNYLNLVNSDRVMSFFKGFLGGASMTYDYKWLRAVQPNSFTSLHYDIVYMGRGTKNLFTCWAPLGDALTEQGSLALLLGSPEFEKVRKTYGEMDVDRDKIQGWFSSNPFEVTEKFGGTWATTNYRAGDVIIFGMFMMHASLSNQTNCFRISSDTRYQLASDLVDDRWVGQSPKAHTAPKKDEAVSMETARAKWGV